MLNIIKTAIITIIISFISGVLLDRYKNGSARIQCSMRKLKTRRNDGKKAYVIDIKNVSKTTIHHLNLNIQCYEENLTVDDGKITRGLRYKISNVDNIYDISIPFLSKNDEFSIKAFIDDAGNDDIEPVVALRSPEKFKRIDKNEASCFSADKAKRNKEESSKKNIFKNKQVILSVAAVAVLFVVVFIVSNLLDTSSNSIFAGSRDDSINTTETQNSNSTDDNKPDSNNSTTNNSVNTNSAPAHAQNNSSQNANNTQAPKPQNNNNNTSNQTGSGAGDNKQENADNASGKQGKSENNNQKPAENDKTGDQGKTTSQNK